MGRGQYQRSAAHRQKLQGNKHGTVHGHTSRSYAPPEYVAWQNMRARCNRATHPSYQYYGGRGIAVCPEWDSFERFLEDVGQRPDPSLSLDRIDNDRGYEPGNVRWATRVEQAANRRNRCLPGCECKKHSRRVR